MQRCVADIARCAGACVAPAFLGMVSLPRRAFAAAANVSCAGASGIVSSIAAGEKGPRSEANDGRTYCAA